MRLLLIRRPVPRVAMAVRLKGIPFPWNWGHQGHLIWPVPRRELAYCIIHNAHCSMETQVPVMMTRICVTSCGHEAERSNVSAVMCMHVYYWEPWNDSHCASIAVSMCTTENLGTTATAHQLHAVSIMCTTGNLETTTTATAYQLQSTLCSGSLPYVGGRWPFCFKTTLSMDAP